MREIRVMRWCDAKHGDDERERIHAQHEVVVAMDRAKPLMIDLCDDHYMQIVDPLRVLLDERGAPADQPQTPQARSNAGRKVDVPSVKLPAPPCPVCGTQSPTRGALGQHLKQKHGKGLLDFPELALPNSPISKGLADRRDRTAAAESTPGRESVTTSVPR